MDNNQPHRTDPQVMDGFDSVRDQLHRQIKVNRAKEAEAAELARLIEEAKPEEQKQAERAEAARKQAEAEEALQAQAELEETERAMREAVLREARETKLAEYAEHVAPAQDAEERERVADSIYEADLPEELTAPMLADIVEAARSRLVMHFTPSGTTDPVADLLEKVPSIEKAADFIRYGSPLDDFAKVRQRLGFSEHFNIHGSAKGDLQALLLLEALHGSGGLVEYWQNLHSLEGQTEEVAIEYDWIVPDLLAAQDRVVVYAQTGHGKSWFIMQHATDIARGVHPLTGEELPDGPRKVLYVDLEMGLEETIRRLRVLSPEASNEHLLVRSFQGQGLDVTDPTSLVALKLLIASFEPDVLCIGPVKNMFDAPISGNKPATSDAYKALGNLVELWSASGMAVMLEHHTTDSGNAMAGEGTLPRSLTHVMHLKSGQLKMDKNRGFRLWESLGQLVQAAPLVVGQDNGRWTIKGAAPSSSSATAEAGAEPEPGGSEHAGDSEPTETAEQRRERVRSYVADHPEEAGNLTALSETLDIPRSNLKRDRTALREAGHWPE